MSIRTALFVIAACVLVPVQGLRAEPFRPGSDAEVLERLPGSAQGDSDRATRVARALLQRDPGNLDLALRLAWIHVDRARVESDPRHLGRAQAVLAPWWNQERKPAALLLVRATIEQANHAFDAARADLNEALVQDPSNAQAWLTLASVQQVGGDFDGARTSCERVAASAAFAIAQVCRAAVDGGSGHAAAAHAALAPLLARADALGRAVPVQTWAMTLQGELAERLGRADEAEEWYRASLAKAPADAYTIAAYADFLLDQGRAADAARLIPADTPVDILLLRRALADRALHSPQAQITARDLAGRFAALRARGDRVHLREEARFRCALAGEPAAGLELALQNWAIQKEPLDARIALECALAAGRPDAVATVIGWIERAHLEGPRLAELAGRLASR